MSDATNNMPIPDFLDISPDVQAAAQAAANPQYVLKPPATAKSNKDKKDKVYERWTESAVIENAFRETTKTGLLSAVVALKVRTGMPNANARPYARHMLHPALMAGPTNNAELEKKYRNMTDKSIYALTTLLQSTGLMPTEGGLKGSLLSFLFPPKGQPGASSQLRGKAVIAAFINSDRTDKDGKPDGRQTNVEAYLPDDVEG